MGSRVLLIALLILPAGLLFGSDPQTSGKWVLQVAQSDFGQAARPTQCIAEFTVRGDVVNSTQTCQIAGSQQKNQMIWYLDGLRHPSQKPAPGFSVSNWNGHTLVNKSSSSDGLYKETIRVTLSPDGQTATETVDTKLPRGSNHEKLIWKRAD